VWKTKIRKKRKAKKIAKKTIGVILILIKNIYTLCGRKRFLLPVTYISTNLVKYACKIIRNDIAMEDLITKADSIDVLQQSQDGLGPRNVRH